MCSVGHSVGKPALEEAGVCMTAILALCFLALLIRAFKLSPIKNDAPDLYPSIGLHAVRENQITA